MVNPAIQDKQPYYRVRPKDGGTWAVCKTRAEAIDMTDGHPSLYTIEEKWMTPAQFESIPEFGGW